MSKLLTVTIMFVAATTMVGCMSQIKQDDVAAQMHRSLSSAIETVEAACGPGTSEQTAAETAKSVLAGANTDYKKAMGSVQNARYANTQTATALASDRRSLLEKQSQILSRQSAISRYESDANLTDDEVSGLGTVFRLVPPDMPEMKSKIAATASNINSNPSATADQKAAVADLMSGINALQAEYANLHDVVSDTDKGLRKMIIPFLKMTIILRKLEEIEIQLSISKNVEELAKREQTLASTQSTYNTAKTTLQEAISKAENARDAARKKAEECSPTDIEWPDESTDWNTTFWDYSSP